MIKSIILIILILAFFSLTVSAIQINQTTLNATGSNTIVSIYDQINVTNISITSTNITLHNMTRTSDIYNVSAANVIHPIIDNQQLNITLAGNTTYYIWRNDTTAPNITLMSPLNASSFSTDTITFIANISDRNTIVNCSLWIEQGDGFKIRQTNTSPNNGKNMSFRAVGLPNGYHYWMYQCIDQLNNTRNSSIRNFTVSLQSGASAGGSAGRGAASLDTTKATTKEVPVPREVTKNELLMHINTPLIDKLFPDYKENIPNNNICEIGEDIIFINTADCRNINWINFIDDKLYYYSWVSRYLAITMALVAIGPSLLMRRKVEI